jgi:MOSC domain-containing protein YiiM
MKLLAVCIGTVRPTPGRKAAKTGIFKEPVDHPVLVGREGLAGDRIVDRKHHGGVDQAVYLEGSIDLDWWARELDTELRPGTFGENLVVEGVDNRNIAVGDRFEIGEILLEVTSARMPCATFSARMDDRMFVRRYTKAARPGAYLRVIREGMIRVGDDISYIPFQGDRITMPDLMRTYSKKLDGEELARYLAAPIHHKLRAFLTA